MTTQHAYSVIMSNLHLSLQQQGLTILYRIEIQVFLVKIHCSTPQGSPGVGRNTFLSSPHLCFIIVFICDLFVSRDDPLMS